MIFKKFINLFMIVIFITVGLSMYCFGDELEKFELKWSTHNSPDHVWSIVARKISEEIFEETDGRIDITVYDSGALGTAAEGLNMLRSGSLAFLTSGPTILTSFHEPVQIFSLPYIYDSIEHAHEVFKKDFVDEWFNEIILEKSNVRTIAFWLFGERHLTTNNIAVNVPEDLSGSKIRCMEGPVFKDVVIALGGNPTPVAFSELYLSLQTGVVDGQENPIPTIYDQKFHEVQNYLILTKHNVHMGSVHVSETIWQKIPENDRKIILDVFERNNSLIDEMILQQEKESLEKIRERGVTVIEPDIDVFEKVARKHIWENYKDQWGEYILEANPNYNKF